MNHVFALVWNASTGCWTVTHEHSKRCRKGSRRLGKLAVPTLLLGAALAQPAQATCSAANTTITCSGVPNAPLDLNDYSSSDNDLTVNVTSGTQMNAAQGGWALDLRGMNITLSNFGTIDPRLQSQGPMLSGGVFIGNGAASTVRVDNNVGAAILGSNQPLGPNLTSIDGLAIAVNNAVMGTTTITNNGQITSSVVSTGGGSMADTPVVGVYGGSEVIMNNSSSGRIQGRVAFEKSAAGNVFTNAGIITGSVSMGAGGTNSFYAITGSSVSAGDGIQTGQGLGGLSGVNLTFAPTGTVDGGLGGVNTLILQNMLGVGGGPTGTGQASSSTYVNFNKLILNSGTWTLQGPLVTGSTILNGGIAQFDNGGAFGSGVLTSNGGTIQAGNAGLLINNQISLGPGGLTVQGTNSLTLAGMLSGSGGLTKSGAALLTLTGSNSLYSGTTSLNGGTLIVGNSTALGSGNLNAANGTALDVSSAMTLANNINLTGNLTLGGANSLSLSGAIADVGGLTKNGFANLTLSGANTYFGNTALNAGTLTLGSDSALGSGALNTAAGTTLDTNKAVSLGNNINLAGALYLVGSNDLTLGGSVGGPGYLVKNGTTTLNLNGANNFTGGTILNSGKLIVGNNGALGSGALSVDGMATLDSSLAQARLANAVVLTGGLNIGGTQDMTLAGVVSGGGGLIKSGAANLTLNANNTFSGGTTLNAGTLTLGNSGALGSSALTVDGAATLDNNSPFNLDNNITLNAGLTLAGSNNLSLSGAISGTSGLTKNGLGVLTLSGNNTFGGNTTVNGGTLRLNGFLASTQVNVNNGGTITGSGAALGAMTINNGGHLALSSGNTLSASSLLLNANSSIDASLAAPSITPLMSVSGNLTLDGNLNVVDAGGFGVGVYRLFNYAGTLTNNNLEVAGVPVGYGLGDILVQTLNSQVNLVVSAPGTKMRFWDGTQSVANGLVDGGSGTWSANGTNWTSSDGLLNQPWAGDFAVFQGATGTVSVIGTQLFTGMQFMTDGYRVVSGPSGKLTAVNGTSGTTAIRVDPGVTATIDANIDGGGILNKLDSGTLVLSGANSYTGGTQLNGGTLVVGNNIALGSGALIASGGTRLDSNTAVTLGNATTLNGSLTVLGSNALALNGVITGAGSLIKSGGASLTLAGNNNFLGPVALNAGGLILASNSALGAGPLNAAHGTTLDAGGAFSASNAINLAGNLGITGSNDLTLTGPINGAGSLTKNGAAKLVLSGANGFLGGITLNAGTLTAGGNSAFGLGILTVSGASSLNSNSSVALGNSVVLNATLTNTGNNDLTLGGVLSGNGALIKNSAANLTLNGSNTFGGGTTLKAGTLTLGSNTALGSGALTVAGDSALDTVVPLNLANDINANANLDVTGSNNLALSGVLSGAGTLTKNGTADLALTGNNTFSGTFNVQSGSLTTLSNSALGSNAGVILSGATTLNLGGSASIASLTGSGTAQVGFGNNLSIGGSNASSTFNGAIAGTGTLDKLGSGTLTLAGNNTLTGDTTVDAGTLRVNGSLDSASVWVNNGATLAGSGILSGNVNVADGGHLAGVSGSTLSVNSLVFNANSSFDAGLGAPVAGGGYALVSVGGNLTLDGTLNVSDIGGFGNGVYRLFNYTGSLVDNGMLLGSLPGVVAPGDLALQTALANQVNLLVSAPGSTVQFWDGNQLLANGSVDGGSGIWGTGSSNWTDINGTTNRSWANSFAVFQGAAGTVTVNGAQTTNGMQFVTDGYRLQSGTAGALNLINGSLGNAAIRVDPNATATIDVELTGTGSLGKYDSGTLVLNAANSYSGGTQLNGGTLVLGNAGALGSGVLTAANGTTLDNSSALLLNNAVTLAGELTLAGSNDLSLAGVISGSGSLTKNGSSTLALNGANTYSGGTVLNGGTLLLGSAGALGSGSLTAAGGTTLDNSAALTLGNAVTLAGELTLAGSNDLSLAGVISGTGSLTKQGASHLTLSGDNSFSGALNILDGSLTLNGNNALGNASLSVSDIATASVGGTTVLGALSGNGNITLASGGELQVGSNNTNSVYDGSLNGPGSLSKTGTGKLVLNGQSSVGGGTQVNAGSLIIGGASGSTASLTSDVQVANGAMLGGHGNIIGRVDLASGATLNPGNSIGTLHVNGDVNLAAGSNLEIEANPDGSSDQLISTGTVGIAGANLKVLAGAGDWAPSTTYSIIQAAAINGTFAGVSSNLAFLTPELAYSSTGVELTLERNEVSFVSVGRTYNQRAAAAGVESLGSGNNLYTAISALTAEQAQAAYDSLSGELHASTQGAMLDDSRYVRDAIGQRLRAAQGQASTDAILHTDADSGMTFWLQGYGGWGDNNGNSNTARLDHDSRGTLLGVDLPVGDNWRVGVAAGYGTSKLDVDARNSSGEIDSTSLSLFAAAQWDQLNLRLGASHAWNDIDSSRHVQVGDIAEHDKASYDANTTQVFGELGYAIAAGDFILEPFAGLAHVKVDSDSFKEHGGSTALHGDSEADEVTYGTLGLHASTALTTLGSVPLALQGTLGWQHAFDDLDPKRQLSFAGGDSFTVKGTPLAQDTALAQLGVSAQVASGTTVDLGYSGQFGDGYKDNGVRLGLNVSF